MNPNTFSGENGRLHPHDIVRRPHHVQVVYGQYPRPTGQSPRRAQSHRGLRGHPCVRAGLAPLKHDCAWSSHVAVRPMARPCSHKPVLILVTSSELAIRQHSQAMSIAGAFALGYGALLPFLTSISRHRRHGAQLTRTSRPARKLLKPDLPFFSTHENLQVVVYAEPCHAAFSLA